MSRSHPHLVHVFTLASFCFFLAGTLALGFAVSPAGEPSNACGPASCAQDEVGDVEEKEAVIPDLSWAEILRMEPDPEIVVDAAARERMLATGLPWLVREPKSGIELLLVPPGEYLRGKAEGEESEHFHEVSALPQHAVRISEPFYLGRTEVTRGQWDRVMGGAPDRSEGEEQLPAVSVNLFDVQGFLSRTGLTLPRDSEWEYACRAGANSLSIKERQAMGWSDLPRELWVQSVTGKRPNAWGFHGMLGNAWEWTGTRFDHYQNYPLHKGVVDQTADDEAWSYHFVMRGPLSAFKVEDQQPWVRMGRTPTSPQPFIGFRVARHLFTQPPALPESPEVTEPASRR